MDPMPRQEERSCSEGWLSRVGVGRKIGETHLFTASFSALFLVGNFETVDVFIEDHGRGLDFLAPSLRLCLLWSRLRVLYERRWSENDSG